MAVGISDGVGSTTLMEKQVVWLRTGRTIRGREEDLEAARSEEWKDERTAEGRDNDDCRGSKRGEQRVWLFEEN